MPVSPTIDELESGPDFEKVLTLQYNDIAPFVIGRLFSFALPSVMIWVVLAISAFLTVWLWPGQTVTDESRHIIKGLLTGLIGLPLLLIPFHEGLHLVPYWLAGARDIRFGADMRQGIIYVTAHRFVTSRSLFSMVALTPFAVITAGLAAAILFASPWMQWVLAMTVFVHATMCTGDAVLTGFMSAFRGRRTFTWDDADAGVAYFCAEKLPENKE
ncbi:MAG: DUF3267 domain-containing protein [Bacteroidales bacterium]|nr:DUF3267 domain-containing protein [Bacteroidales bacterium]